MKYGAVEQGDEADAREARLAGDMTPERDAYDAVCAYTLARRDAEFIHQHVVDACTAQRADHKTKPIALTFALVGLYLLVEGGRSGRQVQEVHIRLGRQRRTWPAWTVPRERGSITAVDVLNAREGPERDRAIHAWCRDVWEAYAGSHRAVGELLPTSVERLWQACRSRHRC